MSPLLHRDLDARIHIEGGVGWLVAGPGSDFSEVPMLGCEPAALEPAAVPACPPGPVPPAMTASLSMVR
jgi:hypothetical protein